LEEAGVITIQKITQVCPVCGGTNPTHAKFCSHCGHAFGNNVASSPGQRLINPQPEAICPRCGTPRTAKAKFCHKCGYQFQKTLSKAKQQRLDRAKANTAQLNIMSTRGMKLMLLNVGVIVGIVILVIGVAHHYQKSASTSVANSQSTTEASSYSRFSRNDSKNADAVIDDIDADRSLAAALGDTDSNDTYNYHVTYGDEGLLLKFGANSDLMSEIIDSDYGAHWNKLVHILTQDSAVIREVGGHSVIKVENPQNSTKILLEVNDGAVSYNVATDN
jgi:ribosomal protein L40E